MFQYHFQTISIVCEEAGSAVSCSITVKWRTAHHSLHPVFFLAKMPERSTLKGQLYPTRKAIFSLRFTSNFIPKGQAKMDTQ